MRIASCIFKSRNTLKYLLTPWCRVLLEKLTGSQLVKKFPAFHGTRRFITALKRPPPVSILGQPNPVHIFISHLLQIHPNIIIILYRRLGGPQVRSGWGENLVPIGIRSLTVQPGSSVAIPTELPGPRFVYYT